MTINFPQRLLEGYASFRAGRYASEAERYRRLGEGQQRPTIMMIACCDSRAAPETIFDAGPGEIFVVRNVANLVPPYAPDGRHHSTSAALEFAVLQLGVQHIVIMGHGRCGGIRAITEPGDPLSTGDFIGKWLASVRDVVATVDDEKLSAAQRLTLVEQASVEHSLANLRTFPWVRAREGKEQITLHGAWFDISLGELNVYDETVRRWTVV
ncbi:carbonic anhydrase [Nordella sp. HKS 07]|uniref:carbonic anhydrase n=1 Tax=Nordella sp. HKS 07 TaxID=2712222 RepID=UPI0013E14420|nr:carbonic anhydrase [Nordella sp. HKS 07]QIG46344.1 carbonic anhydrase [Nordella sp. HKS 07]